MADISDVEQAIANTVNSLLYPAGSTQSSTVGVLCRIYRGWPNSATLNADLTAGAVNVTIVTDNDAGRTTTRYLPEWRAISSRPAVILSTSDQSIVVSGTPEVGDVVGALVDGSAYAYRVRAADTAHLVAANLCQLMAANLAMVQGQTIIVPGARTIEVRSVHDCAGYFESRRQEKDVRIICWCPTPAIRDAVASGIDSAINQDSFIVLSDQTLARVNYKNTSTYDQAQNAMLYRRDLIYTVEYSTVAISIQPSMLFGASGINGNITYG